jgi:hypothetical protein
MTTPRRRRRSKKREIDQPGLFGAEDILPYGILDLNPQIQIDTGPPLKIRCFVQGCSHMLRPPTRKKKGDTCPAHEIRCHRSGTFHYPDVRRNVIVAKEMFATRIVGHPGKFESHRLGLEKSEDTATFNLYRSFQEAKCLNYIARLITGLDITDEPQLFLWGLNLTDDSLTTWPLLQAARERFEKSLPVRRPLTEPDAGLFLDGSYLILNEIKLTSPNTFYFDGPRRNAQSLTKDELLTIYHDPICQILDVENAKAAEAIPYQLWRNTIFAEWMAYHAAPGTRAYFANLTRAGYEIDSFEHFFQFVRPEYADRVTRIRWEDLFILASLQGNKLAILREYLATKTVNLQPAFLIAQL